MLHTRKLGTPGDGVSSKPVDPYSILVADFETTTDPNDCRVWLWAVASVTEERVLARGEDILSFVQWISQRSSTVSFHNLKFDGFFILDWLLNNGYTWKEKWPAERQFTTMISDMGQFYSITVHWGNGQKTQFRDSFKKLPMTVKRIAQSFKLEESKGEIDYDAPRPVGYKPTDEELEYVYTDVLIVAKALKHQQDEGLSRLTVGSDALKTFEQTMGKQYRRIFPVLADSVDAEIRRAYRGGFTYADPRFKCRVVGPGHVFDVNSLYPSVMYDRLLPWGEPRLSMSAKPEPDERWPLYVMTVVITARLKPDHIPCIPISGGGQFGAAVYAEVIDEPRQFSCTSVDWELWNEHYDIDIISYDGAWMFRAASGFFCDYIDKWMKVKAESEGGTREIAKLMLNSLYGKFATNPDVSGKYPLLGTSPDFALPVVLLKAGKEEYRDPVYTPVGVFITAYARAVTIRAAQANYETFAYCDTDSLHLVSEQIPSNLDIDPTRLGAWKHEMHFQAAWFERAKCYTEQDQDGTYHTKVAGLPRDIASQITFDDYTHPRIYHGKLSPRRVPGGVVLEPVPFTLNTTLEMEHEDGTQAED